MQRMQTAHHHDNATDNKQSKQICIFGLTRQAFLGLAFSSTLQSSSSTMNTNSSISLPNNTCDVLPSAYNSTLGNDTTTSYEQSRRQISSVIISEQFLEPSPDLAPVIYVEVPVIEERVRTVPVRSIVDVEKIVPKYEYEFVDKIKEVPQIQYVDRTVEKEVVQEVIRNVANKQIIDRPREVIRTIPKVEYVQVEKVMNVPGEVIEIPKRYDVEQRVDVSKRVDKEVPVVVAQTIHPVITESQDVIDVDIYEYEPNVIPVEVHVAKPVASQLLAVGATQHMHQMVTVPAAQFNTMLRSLNSHLRHEEQMHLPYIKEYNNIPFLPANETPGIIYPVPNAQIHNMGTMSITTRGEVAGTTSSLYNNLDNAFREGTVSARSSQITTGGLQQIPYHGASYEVNTTSRGDAHGAVEVDSAAHPSYRSVAASHQKSLKTAKLSHSGLVKKRSGCNC